tara:strand:+ start:256 stop:756 length:501 start_codon:yes stop_codon:yes gene_type:complete
MLAKSKIAWAINETQSMKQAARLLGVAYNTFKKYAKMYDLFEPLPSNAGIPKNGRVGVKPPELQSIFKGEYPSYSQTKLQERCIREGYLAECCSNCGFNDKRHTDLSVPLLLDYMDDDGTNKSLDNLRLLCYNCFYIMKGNRLKVDIPKNVRGFRKAVGNLFASSE